MKAGWPLITCLTGMMLCHTSGLLALNPIQITDDRGEYNVAENSEIQEDPSNKKTIDEVSNPDGHWLPNQGKILNLGYSPSAWWLRFSVHNLTSVPRDLYVSLQWNSMDRVEGYVFERKQWNRRVTGDQFPYEQWDVKSLSPALRVQIAPGEERTVYIRLASESILTLPIKLMKRAEFRTFDRMSTAIVWLFLGMGLVLFLFALVLSWIFRDEVFYHYVLYIPCLALALFSEYGNAFEVLWPTALDWQNRSLMFFFPLSSFSAFLFMRSFVGETPFQKWLDRGTFFFSISMLILPILSLRDVPYVVLVKSYACVHIAGSLFMLGCTLRATLGGNQRAKFLLVVWGAMLSLRAWSLMFNLEILPYSGLTVYGWVFLLPLDLALLSSRMKELAQRGAPVDEDEIKQSYSKSRIVDLDVDAIKRQLFALLEAGEITRKPHLRMADVASALSIPSYQLSELLNNVIKKSFRNLINEYRVRAATELLLTRSEDKVQQIAFEVGFHSKSAFNQAFRKITTLSPMDYRRAHTPHESQS